MGTVDTRVARRGYFRISLLAGVYYLFAVPNPFDIPRRRINRSADHRVRSARFPRANVNVVIPLGRHRLANDRTTIRCRVVVQEIGSGDSKSGISDRSECRVSLRQMAANLQLRSPTVRYARGRYTRVSRFHGSTSQRRLCSLFMLASSVPRAIVITCS